MALFANICRMHDQVSVLFQITAVTQFSNPFMFRIATAIYFFGKWQFVWCQPICGVIFRSDTEHIIYLDSFQSPNNTSNQHSWGKFGTTMILCLKFDILEFHKFRRRTACNLCCSSHARSSNRRNEEGEPRQAVDRTELILGVKFEMSPGYTANPQCNSLILARWTSQQ